MLNFATMKTLGSIIILAIIMAYCTPKRDCYCYDFDYMTGQVTDETVITTKNNCRNIEDGYDKVYKKKWDSCIQTF